MKNNKFHHLNSQYSPYCNFRHNVKINPFLSVVWEKSKWMKDEKSYYVHVPWTVFLQVKLEWHPRGIATRSELSSFGRFKTGLFVILCSTWDCKISSVIFLIIWHTKYEMQYNEVRSEKGATKKNRLRSVHQRTQVHVIQTQLRPVIPGENRSVFDKTISTVLLQTGLSLLIILNRL